MDEIEEQERRGEVMGIAGSMISGAQNNHGKAAKAMFLSA